MMTTVCQPLRHALFAMACFVLMPLMGGCQLFETSPGGDQPVSGAAGENEPVRFAEMGIDMVEQGHFEHASALFNNALQMDPTNSYLHYLAALAYHLQADQGNSAHYPLAVEGYRLAVKFDHSNWMAHYQLGLIEMRNRNFLAARETFSEAALYREDDPDILYSLAVASYYAHDPVAAAGFLNRLTSVAEPSPRALRASALVMAAVGKAREAGSYLTQYRTFETNEAVLTRLSRRLQDWEAFHAQGGRAPHLHLTQGYDPAYDPAYQEDGDQPIDPEEAIREATEYDLDNDDPDFGDPSLDDDEEPIDSVIVDVVIVRTEENLTTSKGVNLLSGLTLQFGDGDFNNAGLGFKTERSETIASKSVSVVKAISLKALEYSLNIANSNTRRNEILARPSLLAVDGLESEFFSGNYINAAAVAAPDATSGTGAEVEMDIGVRLAVTPNFLPDGRVKLNVEAERTFLTTPNTTSIQFQYRIDTSKTNVKANVVMRLGDTLILSGLSEKEVERGQDGVPLLQDIPGIQYLFSKETTQDFQKSVLILLTPRRPQYLFHPEEGGVREGEVQGASLAELRARYNDWFKPYPNWASIFNHLQENKLYREFRTGDVSMEKWGGSGNLAERLSLARKFLHY